MLVQELHKRARDKGGLGIGPDGANHQNHHWQDILDWNFHNVGVKDSRYLKQVDYHSKDAFSQERVAHCCNSVKNFNFGSN